MHYVNFLNSLESGTYDELARDHRQSVHTIRRDRGQVEPELRTATPRGPGIGRGGGVSAGPVSVTRIRSAPDSAQKKSEQRTPAPRIGHIPKIVSRGLAPLHEDFTIAVTEFVPSSLPCGNLPSRDFLLSNGMILVVPSFHSPSGSTEATAGQGERRSSKDSLERQASDLPEKRRS